MYFDNKPQINSANGAAAGQQINNARLSEEDGQTGG